MESQFSTLYHWRGEDADADVDMDGGAGSGMYGSGELVPLDPSLRTDGYSAGYGPPTAGAVYNSLFTLADPMFVDSSDSALVSHYLFKVRPMQFFLADRSIDGVIFDFAQSSDIVRSAICYVASVHRRRLRESPPMGNAPLPGTSSFSSRAQPLTLPSISSSGTPLEDEGDEGSGLRIRRVLESNRSPLTEAEAMAGLQCISSYLFAGGKGGWDFFLRTACGWVASVLPDPKTVVGAGRYVEALERAGAAGESGLKGFIVRTTMWFEVLASVSQVRRPQFLEAYRELFGHQRVVGVVDGEEEAPPRGFSMLNVMGCDNMTFLAIAEASALAAWKDETQKEGRMSLMELTKRGMEIEEKYLREDGHHYRSQSLATTGTSGSTTGDSVERRRRLTADIFRAAARLFVHTVLNEDNLACNEIVDGVQETVKALQRVPKDPETLLSSVVRSVVFPICLAGCMTDDRQHRQFLKGLLMRQQTAGNSTQVLEAMEKVWAQRQVQQARTVPRRSTSGLRSSLAASGGPGGAEGKSWRDVVREVLLV